MADLPASQGRSAAVIGAFGQDGHYLSSHLDGLGYHVLRIGNGHIEGARRSQPLDLSNRSDVADFIREFKPHEVYYLAAFHHSSEEAPPPLSVLLDKSMRTNFDGFVNVLEAVANLSPRTKVFMASSALVFGDAETAPQSEATPVRPTTAYGLSKAAAMSACELYRRERGLFAVSGILFNHESPRRRPQFVSRKIATAAANAARGSNAILKLGLLDAQVDWSAAEDVVRAAHAMLQVDVPRDCVIASGRLHSVRDFARIAFASVNLDYEDFVVEDQDILQRRVAIVPRLGDPSRLRDIIGFTPRISFEDMVQSMVRAEVGASG